MTRNFADLGDNAREEKRAADAAKARLTRKTRTRDLEEEKVRALRTWSEELTAELARTLGAEPEDEEFAGLQWEVDDRTDSARVKLGFSLGDRVRLLTTFQGVPLLCECLANPGDKPLNESRDLFNVRPSTRSGKNVPFDSAIGYADAVRRNGWG